MVFCVMQERFEFNVDEGRTWILERLSQCCGARLKAAHFDPYDPDLEARKDKDKLVTTSLTQPF